MRPNIRFYGLTPPTSSKSITLANWPCAHSNSSFGVRSSTFDVQCSKFSVQRSTFALPLFSLSSFGGEGWPVLRSAFDEGGGEEAVLESMEILRSGQISSNKSKNGKVTTMALLIRPQMKKTRAKQ